MKRTLLCALLTVCVCLSLCGCGAMDNRIDNPVIETPLLPTVTPDLLPTPDVIETPDVNNGIVRDEDGEIEDGDTGSTKPEATQKPQDTQESPSPEPNSIP